MIKLSNEKIAISKVMNLHTLLFNIENEDYLGNTFDLIFTQMVLHHINNIDSIFEKFYRMLNPGGYLAIADLYPEDGSFHGEGFDGHLGFDVKKLSDKLEQLDFIDIQHQKCFNIRRVTGQIEQQFPIFLLTSKRK